eukprot:Sspe_Gene.95904::Locus_68255_Transcript_1_1_Confidence_1.000_Length_916::g.95904::m.95904
MAIRACLAGNPATWVSRRGSPDDLAETTLGVLDVERDGGFPGVTSLAVLGLQDLKLTTVEIPSRVPYEPLEKPIERRIIDHAPYHPLSCFGDSSDDFDLESDSLISDDEDDSDLEEASEQTAVYVELACLTTSSRVIGPSHKTVTSTEYTYGHTEDDTDSELEESTAQRRVSPEELGCRGPPNAMRLSDLTKLSAVSPTQPMPPCGKPPSFRRRSATDKVRTSTSESSGH